MGDETQPGQNELPEAALPPPPPPEKEETAQPMAKPKLRAPDLSDVPPPADNEGFIPLPPLGKKKPPAKEAPEGDSVPFLPFIPLPPINRRKREPEAAPPPPPEAKPKPPAPHEVVEEAVERYLNHPARRAVQINTAVGKAVLDAEAGLTSDEIDERMGLAAAVAKAQWESDEAKDKRAQACKIMTGELCKRLVTAKNPDREAVVIASELYESEKKIGAQTVVTASLAELEKGVYHLRHAKSGSKDDIIANEKADELMGNILMLRGEGHDVAADKYEKMIREHKAVPTPNDKEALEHIKLRERARNVKEQAENVQASVDVQPQMDELGGFAPTLPKALKGALASRGSGPVQAA